MPSQGRKQTRQPATCPFALRLIRAKRRQLVRRFFRAHRRQLFISPIAEFIVEFAVIALHARIQSLGKTPKFSANVLVGIFRVDVPTREAHQRHAPVHTMARISGPHREAGILDAKHLPVGKRGFGETVQSHFGIVRDDGKPFIERDVVAAQRPDLRVMCNS